MQLSGKNEFETFFGSALDMNPRRVLIKREICGVRIGGIEEPLMLEIRRLDKLIHELEKGKSLSKRLREPPT
jgi:hypothetical protein